MPGSGSELNGVSSPRLDPVPVFAAFCLFLSTVEVVIPKPLPFMRLGLANLPLLLAITVFTPRQYAQLVLAKILGMGLVSGTLFSYVFLFSCVGSVVSGFVMYSVKRLLGRHIGYVGVSVLGAAASNGIQIFLAAVSVFGHSALLTAPPFLLSGLVTGVGMGLYADRFSRTSRWFARLSRQEVA